MSNWSKKYLALINHVVFVLDASGSMRQHRTQLLRVFRQQVAELARLSEETGQETRVSVYLFDNRAQCVIYDMDVLRMPNLDDIYDVGGMTALLDATDLAIEELSQTATLHGDHAFLLFAFTDGAENASQRVDRYALSTRIHNLRKWTVACFVPSKQDRDAAVSFGFPLENVVTWDAGSVKGVSEVGGNITRATANYFTGRASGVSEYGAGSSLFGTGTENLNAATVSAANLVPLDPKTYAMLPVRVRQQSRPFVMEHDLQYVNGKVYYLFMKTEHIQAGKEILVVEKRTNRVFAGADARRLIGLPSDVTIKGKPTLNPEYDIYVQSTAPNRNLIPNTTCIVRDPVRLKVSA